MDFPTATEAKKQTITSVKNMGLNQCKSAIKNAIERGAIQCSCNKLTDEYINYFSNLGYNVKRNIKRVPSYPPGKFYTTGETTTISWN